MREAATDQLLDELQQHAEADDHAERTVRLAIADGIVTAGEAHGIAVAFGAVRETRGPVRWRSEHIRSAIRLARSVLYTGQLTPKLNRQVREAERDLEEVRRQLAAFFFSDLAGFAIGTGHGRFEWLPGDIAIALDLKKPRGRADLTVADIRRLDWQLLQIKRVR